MRIGIALGPFHELPPAGFGAVEKVWSQLGEAFALLGHEVHVVGKRGAAPAPQRPYSFHGLRGFTASGWLPWDLLLDLLYGFQVTASLPRADVVVTNSFWLPVLLRPFKRTKGRLVVHVARYPKGQMRLYRGADIVHTVSSEVAGAIARECPALAPRICVIGYPIDIEVFRPADGTAATRGMEILYVGRIHPEKGLALLIAAARELHRDFPHASLAIVGPHEAARGGGGERYLESLREQAQGVPVRFEPPIGAEPDLARRLQAASVFCYPSIAERGETFGRAVLEAMACGLPCVVSALGCFSDLLGDGEDAIVFDHRAADAPARLAAALRRILGAAVGAREMGRRARARAERYSTHAIVAAYVRMLESTPAEDGAARS